MLRRRTLTIAAVASGLLLMTSACAQPQATTSPTPDDPAELIEIKVPAVPLIDAAPLWVAVDEGIFEAHGLAVTIDPSAMESGSSSAALVISGEYKFAATTVINVAQTQAQGLDLVIATGSTVFAGPDDTSVGVIALESGPDNVEALAAQGNVLGVNGIGNITDVLTQYAIDLEGGDPSVPTYQNVPYRQGLELVLNGSVTSATLAEPFLTAAVGGGEVTLVGYVSSAAPQGSPAMSFITSGAYAQEQPEVVDAFRASFVEAIEWIDDPANADALQELIVKYTGLDPALASASKLPTYSTAFSEDVTEEYLDIVARYGGLDALPSDIQSLFADGALDG